MGGGLALFLCGMRKMTESLKIAAGGMMKNMLGRRIAAVVVGEGDGQNVPTRDRAEV